MFCAMVLTVKAQNSTVNNKQENFMAILVLVVALYGYF
jgi:hypothetical protein